jgi:lipid-binding SYLF domain-containing protein
MRKQYENGLMKRGILPMATMICLLMPLAAQAAAKGEVERARMTASGSVIKEALYGHSGIPLDVLDKAECVIVLPSVKKAAFIVGASYGRGVMTCRRGANMNGRWSTPTMMQSTGGSFGFQAGGQETDFVLLVMNDKGARAMLNGKVKLGGDASIAAGPVGRTAEAATNASMNAEILSYSHAKGIFAGVSLSGSTLGPDDEANENFYGKKVTATDVIVKGEVKTPPSAHELLTVLTAKSPRNTSKK